MFDLTKKDEKTYAPQWKSKISLYPHQIKTIKDLENAEKDHKFYFLSDLTGFGKTISIMAMIYRTNNRWIPYDLLFMNPNIKLSSDPGKIKLRDVYITPLHLYAQVCAEAKRCGINSVNIKTYKGCERTKYDDDVDLIIISCTMVASFFGHHSCVPFYRIIVDEADTINLRSKLAPLPYATYRHMMLVSATLKELGGDDSDSGDEWYYGRSTKHNLNRVESKGILPKFKIDFVRVKNKDEDIINFFKASFVVNELTYKHKMSKILNVISRYAPDTVGHALSVGDVDKAMRLLNTRTRQKGIHNIATVMLGYLEEKLGKAYTDEDKDSIQRRIDHLKVDMAELKEEPCVICYSPIERCTVTPCCQHLICSECILQWMANQRLTKSCPLCRSPINVDSLHVIETNYIEDKNDIPKDIPTESEIPQKPRDKFTKSTMSGDSKKSMNETAENIFKKYPNGKYLIYSKFSYYSYNAEQYVRNITRNVPFINAAELPSGVSASTAMINKFHSGTVNCLFLDPNNQATGLNFQETTDILILGDFSESTVVQIRGRALRLGREVDLPLRIHLLTYEK
jgi:hypothetical protein